MMVADAPRGCRQIAEENGLEVAAELDSVHIPTKAVGKVESKVAETEEEKLQRRLKELSDV